MQKKLWNKARRVLAGLMALAMVLMNLSDVAVYADETAEVVTEIDGEKTVYDFRDGSIIPTDTDGKGTVTSADGKLTVACGPSNAYAYNGADHGVQFKTGNTITITVPEKAQVWIGGCQYSAADASVAYSVNGAELEVVNTKTATCYHQDGAAVPYTYEGEAGELVLTFTNSTYVPVITVIRAASQQEDAGADEGSESITEESKETVAEIEGTKTVYDFRDGSIVPTDTDGKATVSSLDGKLTVACGPSNAYGYNGADHGVQFKTGNTVTIAVPEKAQVWIGGCQYSAADATVSFSMGGTELATVNTKTATCYHQDGAAVPYTYEGAAGDLVLTFTNTNYVPVITVIRAESQQEDTGAGEDTGESEGTETTVKTTTEYNFCDGSIVPTDTDGKGTVTSMDGLLTVACGPSNAYQYNGAQHGVAFKTGNTITINVPEKATITIGGCQYSNSTAAVTFSMNGTELSTVNTKTAACYDQDNTAVVTYAYEGEAGDLVLTFENTTYVPTILVEREETKTVEMIEVTTDYNFCDGSIVPTDTDGKATVTSADGKLTVACGPSNAYQYNGAQHGVAFKTGNTITIAVPEKASICIGGCQYSGAASTVTFSMDGTELATMNTKTATCYHQDGAAVTYEYEGEAGDLVLTFADQTYVPVITVVRTEVKPDKTEVTANVTIKDDQQLLGDSKVLFVNKADVADVIDATAGGAVTVKVNATYEIKTDNADISAKNGNFTAFMTATEDVDIVITIASTVIKPVVTIVDQTKVLGDATLTLTNNEDATDVVTLANGKEAKLRIGATYLLGCSSASVTATIAGSKLFKAVDGANAIQVDVVETDTSHHTVDVWDFGAEQLESTETTTYNNKLTADIINSWFPGVEAGTKGVNIAAFEVLDENGNVELAFADGGYATTHRLRTTNTALTRYDEKSLKDLENSDIVYSGYLYSNKSASADVHFKVAAEAGDIFTFVVSSNGTTSNVTWTAPSGEAEVQVYDAKSSNAQKMTFYATEDGFYTLHSATEKIVLARVYRERPDVVTVSGSVSAPAAAPINGATLEFTNMTTGVVTKAQIADGKYEVALSEQYAYAMKLVGANGYIVDENNVFSIKNEEGNKTVNVNIIAVDLVTVSGSLADLTAENAKELTLEFISENVFIPEITINAEDATYSALLEKGVKYEVKESGVEDYTLETTTVQADEDGTLDIKFAKKPVYAVNVTVEGVSEADVAGIKLTFTRLNEEFEADGYVYTFVGTNDIALRDGQYQVKAELAGYKQKVTADAKVNGAAQTISVVMSDTRAESVVVPYAAEITVGTNGDYKTVNEALEAVRHMTRENNERVVISIEPGNYEEMLVIDVENVTLKNASDAPSIELANKGVDIAEGAVRITSYYGHGYTYYSMGGDCKYDEELLAVNKANGYPSFVNPGSGTTAGSYWNATVVVTASGFEADGIIFENSFNQYVSEKAANDVIVKQGSAKEGSTARTDMKAGDVTVQNKAYVERAAALAIYNNINDVVFDNCKFVGRQDTLYGGTNSYVEFNDCSIYGGTDYIFGGMIAIFNKCDLVFNTSEDKNDVGYITAAQQKSGRGYLMYECHVTSTTPGVDTASEYTSKPGYLGRPWQADTSEVIFYNTTIDAADEHWGGGSLINPIGWNNTLSGESAGMCEYGTIESAGVDNSASRATWTTVLTEAKLSDGTEISLEAFRRVVEEPTEPSVTTVYTFDAATESAIVNAEKKGAIAEGKYGTEGYFTLTGTVTRGNSSTYSAELGKAETGKLSFTVTDTADAAFVVTSTGGSNTSDFALVDSNGNKIMPAGASSAIVAVVGTSPETEIKYTNLEAGTYTVVAPSDGANTGRGFRVLKAEVKEIVTVVTTEYIFDAATESAIVNAEKKGAIAEGKYGTDGYFTLTGTVTRGNSSTYSAELGKAETGKMTIIVTGTADLKVVATSTGSSNTSDFALVDGSGNKVVPSGASTAIVAVVGTSPVTEIKYTGLTVGTYSIVAPADGTNTGRGFRVLSAVVTETTGGSRPARADWSTVEAPVITNIALNPEDANKIDVTVKAFVDYDGADKITVVMTTADGSEVASVSSAKEATEHTLTFKPENSGTYTFSVKAIREGEEDKVGAETMVYDFILPLATPNIKGAYNVGEGKVEVEWDAVKEAEKYIVSVVGTDISLETTDLIASIEGLEAGKTYTIKLVAVRGSDFTEATVEKTVEATAETKWYFSAYGSSTNTKNNGYELLEDGSVRVYSTGGKGKIVPGSTDGLAYYYTTIDPDTTNFTLSATAVVNEWTLSNGQEGFGIMASDRAGKHGDGTAFWNNAYMAIVSKVEYYFDMATGKVTDDSSAAKVSMKLGVGSQEKVGVTAENLASFEANDTAVINEFFSSTTTTLDSSCGASGAGTYNIVGNYKGTEPTGTVDNTVTEFKFTIQKNNTGYFVSYTDAEGNTTTQKYYDTEALSQIEKDSVCLGFFASRNADVTFKDITFTTVAPEDDAPTEERPVELITPNFAITSATVSNSADYELVYVGNADGTLVIKNNAGKVLLKNTEVKANEKVTLDVKLALGNNTYKVTFTPDADYVPGEYQKLSSYDSVSFKHVVNYKAYGEAGTSLYVSPNGSASGNGTKEKPLDIYTAVKYVQAGQTIVIMEGTYNLKSTVKVERGIDGTADNMIYMVADPEATSRPVFDFGGRCAGMVLAGDYWYFKGFDVTRSADAQKGIQVSGDNNVLDQINAYRNGNTGIQISRYLSTDTYADWPANNLILNCTSYLNADKGYEDADGFAAKLTVGDGNVFDGCIAYYNADDGWDLFAKVQTGCIGAVTIQNCIAYKNGYDLDENGNEINAGNGNGFKMGGDSMTGGHILKNSIAFFNKAKGIDSNSCPDIKVYNSIAFNNGSYNVAFYTNTAANTDYYADGVISYRTENLGQAEQLKLVGSQDQSKVYGTTNYYWDATAGASMNSAGAKVTDAWFESLTFTSVDRNADGTINMHGFLELTEAATIGGGLGGTSSSDVEIGEETSGKVQSANKVQQTTGTVVDTVDTIINAESKEEVKEAISDMISDITDIWTEEDETVEDENRQEVAEETCKKAEELVKELIEMLITGDNTQSGISEETAANIASAIEKGEEIVSEVVVKTVEAKKVPKADKNAVEKVLKDTAKGKTEVVQYLDLSVLICTEDGEVLGEYTELKETLKFTIAIPADVDVEGKTVYVVRIHNDEVTILDTVMNADGTVSFETDRFSTYALVFEEEVQAADVDEKVDMEAPAGVEVEEEEDNSSMLTIGAIAALLLSVCSLIIVRRKQSLNK